MLRFLLGLILLPFAMLGLFFAFAMVVYGIDVVDKHHQYHAPAKAVRSDAPLRH